MSDITIDVAIKQIISVLDEGFNGPAEYFSFFSDPGENAGLIKTLAKLTPEVVSKEINGSSIAGQVSHLVFALKATCDFIDGTAYKFDWSKSWDPSEVDQSQWQGLQTQLTIAYNRLRAIIEKKAAESVPGLGASMGSVSHVAYHVGAIRQKMASLEVL